jgi:hypothetical protein
MAKRKAVVIRQKKEEPVYEIFIQEDVDTSMLPELDLIVGGKLARELILDATVRGRHLYRNILWKVGTVNPKWRYTIAMLVFNMVKPGGSLFVEEKYADEPGFGAFPRGTAPAGFVRFIK